MTDTAPDPIGPPEVVALLSTMELFCLLQTGKRRPGSLIAAEVPGLSKQTISDWFNYRYFPKWEQFALFIEFFKEKSHRQDLEILWLAARPAHERAESTVSRSPEKPQEIVDTSPGKVVLSRRAVTTAALATAIAAATAAGGPDLISYVSDHVRGARPENSENNKKYARVSRPVSPVYRAIEDTEPFKHKYQGDRVQLVDVSNNTRVERAYQAVALPHPGDSPTGYGWMPASDLTPE